jgi:hypothetical protein
MEDGYVARDHFSLAASIKNSPGRMVERGLGASAQHDRGADGGEFARDRGSNSAARARYHCDLPG